MTTPPTADAGMLVPETPQIMPPRQGRALHGRSGNSGIVVFAQDADRDQHAGRHAVRQAVLAMPSAGGARVRRPRVPAGHGAFWGVTIANGLTVALSVRDFPTSAAALDDAHFLLDEIGRMRLYPRRSGRRGTAFWITLDGVVVLVSGYTRIGTNAGNSLLRDLRAARPTDAESHLSDLVP